MRFRVFTLAFDPATERFNDEAVREYLADKDVQSVADHFFMKDGTPYLVLVACYRLRPLAPPVEAEASAGRCRTKSQDPRRPVAIAKAVGGSTPGFRTGTGGNDSSARAGMGSSNL